MELREFAGRIFEAAHVLEPLVPVRVTCKKVIDITLDAELPCRGDGTPYTRAELYGVLDELHDPAHPFWTPAPVPPAPIEGHPSAPSSETDPAPPAEETAGPTGETVDPRPSGEESQS